MSRPTAGSQTAFGVILAAEAAAMGNRSSTFEEQFLDELEYVRCLICHEAKSRRRSVTICVCANMPDGEEKRRMMRMISAHVGGAGYTVVARREHDSVDYITVSW